MRLVAPGEGPAIRTSLTAAQTAALQAVAWYSDVLVVGAGSGFTEVAMGIGGARSITTVGDFTREQLDDLRSIVDAYRFSDRVDVMVGPAGQLLAKLYLTRYRFDVVVLDAGSTETAVAERLLKPGGRLLRCPIEDRTVPA